MLLRILPTIKLVNSVPLCLYIQRMLIVTLIGVKLIRKISLLKLPKTKEETPNIEHIVKSNINHHFIIEDAASYHMHK